MVARMGAAAVRTAARRVSELKCIGYAVPPGLSFGIGIYLKRQALNTQLPALPNTKLQTSKQSLS